MITVAELKEQLQAIASNEFQLPAGTDPFPLALAMLDHIGSLDSTLRDNLIYSAFYHWTLKHPCLSPDQLRQILQIALDDQHLFYRLGEVGTESVFTRAFSVLLLPLILIAHRNAPFLTQAEVDTIKTRLLQYYQQEQDLRGYVPEYGWAHAAAHGADALDDLALCPEIEVEDLRAILQVIAQKAATVGQPFIEEEDERMVTAVMSALSRNQLELAEWETWIRGFIKVAREPRRVAGSYRHLNIKNFLRSLYFRLLYKHSSEQLVQAARETLDEISRFKF